MMTYSDRERDVLEQLTNSHPATHAEIDLYQRAAQEIETLRTLCDVYQRRITELELRVIALLKETTR